MRTAYRTYTWDTDDAVWATISPDLTSTAEEAMARTGLPDPADWQTSGPGDGYVPTRAVQERRGRRREFYISEIQIPETDSERIDLAVKKALDYGHIDGDHHKMWVIDQMLRLLTGDRYEQVIAEACDGEDGPDTYEWDIGTAP